MKQAIALLLLAALPLTAPAQGLNFAKANSVTWTNLGVNENSSMPLGNGDVAMNGWTEANGDIVLLLSKADAWSENGQMLKLGRVRVKLTPNPFTAPAVFTQTLKLDTGEIEIQGGKSVVHIWVDANHPVIHVEVAADQPVDMEAKSEIWRTKNYHLNPAAVGRAGFFEWGNPNGLDFLADTVLPAQKDAVAWCHFNTNSVYPLVFQREHLEALLPKYPDPLMHRAFGVMMKGPGLVSSDNVTLKSAKAAKSVRLDLYALTQQADSPEAWQTALDKVVKSVDAVSLKTALKAHQQWWADFWNRSWVKVGGTPTADKVSQSYAMQRYMTACAGRGAQPIKFNGSIFTVGHDLAEGASSAENNHDPDYRAWGASYWNQNTRLIYWPLMASGDEDMLAPWYNMYVSALPLVKDRTQAYFHHDGGTFVETIYFWGLPNVNDFGWNNQGTELSSPWMRYHVQGAVEVLAQMLDSYEYTQNADLVKKSVLPMADATITFYDQHWKRGEDGKILFSPAQSIETYQLNAVNPTPDIAGLMNVLPRLLALPSGMASAAQRDLWTKVLKDLPPIAKGTTSARGKVPPGGKGAPDGKPVILPAQSYGPTRNSENPELYVAFPYRLYGVGKPDLELARNTYNARLNTGGAAATCWGQDGTMSSILGLTSEAKRVVTSEFTAYGNQKFPWFWTKGHDWTPDMDNGGSGMITLQYMLMQCDGKRIQLLPAWPDDWTADFKLHAPYQTTVEGHVEHGKVSKLKVTPSSRAKDVVVVQPGP